MIMVYRIILSHDIVHAVLIYEQPNVQNQISKDLFISILTQKHIHNKSFHTIELQTKATTEYI